MAVSLYIAAPFNRSPEARAARDILVEKGYVVVSRWHDTHLEESSAQDVLVQEAKEDIADILAADALVLLNDWPKEGHNSKDFEAGFASGLGKRLVIIGEPTVLFYKMPGVLKYKAVADIPAAPAEVTEPTTPQAEISDATFVKEEA